MKSSNLQYTMIDAVAPQLVEDKATCTFHDACKCTVHMWPEFEASARSAAGQPPNSNLKRETSARVM